MIKRLTFLLVLVLAAPAQAQLVGANWGASSAGHLAFATQGNYGGRSTLRIVSPDGQVGAAEAIADNADTPEVALGARGDALVAWIDHEQLWSRYRPPGGPLGPAELVTPRASTFIESLPVALDATGHALIAWAREDGAGGLHVRGRDPASGWGPEQSLGGTDIYRPKIALADNGSAVIAWGQRRPGTLRAQLAASWRPVGGTFGPPQLLNRARRDSATPYVTANDRGDAVVAWIETNERGFTVRGAFRAAGGAFGRPVRLSRVSEATGPSVAIQPSGRMILAWRDNETHRVEARVRSETGVLGRPAILTHALDLNTGPTAVAAGNGAVLWSDGVRRDQVVRLAPATADGRFPTTQTIARVRTDLDTAVASAGNGVSVVADPPFERDDPIRWQRINLA